MNAELKLLTKEKRDLIVEAADDTAATEDKDPSLWVVFLCRRFLEMPTLCTNSKPLIFNELDLLLI